MSYIVSYHPCLISYLTVPHPSPQQDDPKKQEDPAKSPQPKEEGSMNILNSHSPKHDNNRPASSIHDHAPHNTEDGAEVNTLQNNLV